MLQGVSYQIVTRNHMLEMQNLLRRSLGQEEVTQLETNVVLFEDLFWTNTCWMTKTINFLNYK